MVDIAELSPNDWQRLREIRIRALRANPEAFGETASQAEANSETKWRELLAASQFLVATISGHDVGMLSLENLSGDFGATCWIGACWVDESVRGTGVMRSFMRYIDELSPEKNWTVQGLGVWIDNFPAIAAYEKLGFAAKGDALASTRQPGKYYQRMIRVTRPDSSRQHD